MELKGYPVYNISSHKKHFIKSCAYINLVRPKSKMQTPPVSTAPKLLDQLRHQIRRLHYSIRTEQAYVYWVRWFIRFSGLRHPREMGAPEVEAFLTYLAVERKVSASTQNQALSAILFLYREVLKIELPWLDNVVKAKRPQRMPVVLTREEVQAVLVRLDGTSGLILRLAYGTGMRILETARLRVKDIDFARISCVFVRCMRAISKPVLAVCTCRTRWRASIPVPIVIGHGSMFFRRSGAALIRAVARKGVTMLIHRLCSGTCAKPCAIAVLPSSPRRTRCVTASPRTFSTAVTTSARCRSCSVTPT